jgi:phosphodiesterase/alkaline phosphatase D-like protein
MIIYLKNNMKRYLLASIIFLVVSTINISFAQQTSKFNGSIILGRPTNTSITVSLLSNDTLETYLEYGITPGVYTNQTSIINIVSQTPTEIDLKNLQSNTQYYYHICFRQPGQTEFVKDIEYTFHTQRAPGSPFIFDIQADPHLNDPACDPNIYKITLENQMADSPDFLIDLGDTFMTEKFYSWTQDSAMRAALNHRPFFDIIGRNAPVFLVNGNHEAELGWLLNNTSNNIACYAVNARQLYYPAPFPGIFYSGSTTMDMYLNTPRDACYSWSWGDALFIVLDPYWYTTVKPKDGWGWTLGEEQYYWLARTLAQSKATFKFVFLHNLVGGSFDGLGRGGKEFASYFEWGGYNQDGTWGFTTKRPNLPMPIQALLLTNGVNIVFHGHDHFFAKQDIDTNQDGAPELIYQEVPQPSRPSNSRTSAQSYGYTDGVIMGNSGHLRVKVEPNLATVEYVRTFLPNEENKSQYNRMVSYRYNINAPADTNSLFPGTVIPGRPTDSTLALNILTSRDMKAYIEYGLQPGSCINQTTVSNLIAGEPNVIELTGLPADSRCYYRLCFKYPGESDYRADIERTFHTQRSSGKTFTFDLQTDSHIYDKKGNKELYLITEKNIQADIPDFLIDLGDTFGDDHNPTAISYSNMEQLHINQLPFFNVIGSVAPVFLCIGNHEGETIEYEFNPDANPICTYATQARLLYYPNPFPNDFYSGNTNPDIYANINRIPGLPANYYSWQWGDALFVVLDAYRYLPSAKPANLWGWTLGKAQYDWFKQTLEQSKAKYKFVFAHHVLGQTRGAAIWADKYEWGGYNKNGIWEFNSKRPGWAMPIHQLMVANNVTIFFQGHDHVFAKEILDGVIYQEVPMPSDATYHVGDENMKGYIGDILNNSGHVRVTVSDSQVKVDYIRAYLPQDQNNISINGQIAYTYTVSANQ